LDIGAENELAQERRRSRHSHRVGNPILCQNNLWTLGIRASFQDSLKDSQTQVGIRASFQDSLKVEDSQTQVGVRASVRESLVVGSRGVALRV
jgi:hypothetical protein